MNSQTLTRSEMLVMEALWDIGRESTVNMILDRYSVPKPAYTTIATFLRILTEKQYVGRRKTSGMGKTYVYYPLLTRDEYRKMVMNDVKDTLFNSSASDIVSYLVEDGQLTVKEIKELLDIINES
ncbi:MAG: BlaI/MecI/CopY family transcriptional regulator [Prevotella sp.]|nr:BlaI/MecI/CopY family transcriptional regulator [Prevotella sp.]